MKKFILAAVAACVLSCIRGQACTNVIVTPGASVNGSAMVSYAADSHVLFGELYSTPARHFWPGATLDITEWDTYRPLGKIQQVQRTLRTVGNMNEMAVIIGETTWGGRDEQVDPDGIMDYGSLIYVTLQRAKTAREAIDIIVDLANTYGYPSGGETFSIADVSEAWIMDLVGKGKGNRGIVWVARRIPDGYICAHANQARITRFPQDDPANCLFAPDVIEFAREKGWYEGSDADFSFRDAYNPLDFSGARGCDARAWSAFNILCDGVFTWREKGVEVSRSAGEWLRYAMGYELGGEMPLFVKPQRKVSPKDVADVMRDHYEGTPMDMTQDIGAGGNACPYRWRPMDFEWGGKTYCNERAIATQQTGFWFVAEARPNLPKEAAALVWFGCDDAATSYLTPIYVSTFRVPECLKPGNGDILHYSPTSQFWMCNRVAQACYKMYDRMAPFVRAEADRFEKEMMEEAVPALDAKLAKILRHNGPFRRLRARIMTTIFTRRTAERQFKVWKQLEETLLVKFIDGNIKAQNEDGSFVCSEYNAGTPEGLEYGGYNDIWKAAVAREHGSVIEVK